MKVKIINKSGFELPKYETKGAAAFDIRAKIAEGEEICLFPEQIEVVETGLYVAIPEGYELQIRPRSGLAFKHGISIVNTPGTIDSDYRGEIKICVVNHSDSEFYTIKHGDRIAQGIIAPIIQAEWEEVTELDETDRGSGGFGSTGRQ